MLLSNSKKRMTLKTGVALALAFTSLFFFVSSWGAISHATIFVQVVTSFSVFLLSFLEIMEGNDKLLNALSILIVTLPWLYLSLLVVLSFLINL